MFHAVLQRILTDTRIGPFMKSTFQHLISLVVLLCLVSYSQSAEVIKVMSYNIHIATPPSKPDFSHKDLPAIADVINREQPSLVALQEVDKYTERSGKSSDQAKDLAELTGMHYHFAAASQKSDGEQGQAILSKYPIIEAESYKLPVLESSDGETRSLAVVVVEVEGVKVAFMSVHLDHRSNADRKFQIEQMLEHTKRFEEYPIVFGGDFNMKSDNENFSLVKTQFAMVTDHHPLTFPQINPRVAIDFILLNKRGVELFDVERYYTVDEQYASDHLPLVIELKLKQK